MTRQHGKTRDLIVGIRQAESGTRVSVACSATTQKTIDAALDPHERPPVDFGRPVMRGDEGFFAHRPYTITARSYSYSVTKAELVGCLVDGELRSAGLNAISATMFAGVAAGLQAFEWAVTVSPPRWPSSPRA